MKNFTNTRRFYFILCFALLSLAAKAQQPKAAFSSDVTTGCSPLVVQFKDESTGNPTSWSWDLGNGGAPSEKQSPSGVFLNSGTGTVTYTIKLTVKNAKGEDTETKTKYITVYASPQIAFSSDVMQGCPPLNVNFTDATKPGSGTITDMIWDFGNGGISKDPKPNYTYTSPNSYAVSLTATNSFGCRQTYKSDQNIVVFDTVKADFGYNYSNVCQSPAPINFNNTSVSKSTITSYQWVFGDGVKSVETSPVHTYNNVGTYNVQMIAVNNKGCNDTITKSLTIGKVGGDFTFSTACANTAMNFTNTSSTTPVSVLWNFGDGKTDTLISTTHIFAAAGTYNVTMTADFGSCTGTISKQIVVQNKPKAAFTNSKTTNCDLPANIIFTNTSTGGDSFNWSFGDSSTSTSFSTTHLYTKGGFFDVKLVATTTNGCSDTLLVDDAVKIGPPIISSFKDLPIKGCAPQIITPTAILTSAEPIVKYVWDFGDGNKSESITPTHKYEKEGKFTVTLIVFTKAGCSDTLALPNAVIISKPPAAGFKANPLDACAQFSTKFTDTSAGTITNWQWQFGDGGNSTDPNPSHHYIDTGYFNVTLIVGNNECNDTLTVNNYVHIRPPVAAFVSNFTCADPYKKVFSDNSIGALTWKWKFGDGTTSQTTSPEHVYKTPGKYDVVLTVSNNECVDSTRTQVIVVDEKPSITFTQEGSSVCRKDLVKFTATNFNSGNVSSFNWDYGDQTATGFLTTAVTTSHAYSTSGSYTPMLVTKDILGCLDTAKSTLGIAIFGAKANFSNAAGNCLNISNTFTDASVPDGTHPIVKWVWDYGDGTGEIANPAPFKHTYTVAGTYDVKLAVYDKYGCADTIKKIQAIQITDPKASFSAVDPARCTNNNVVFKNASTGVELKYTWNFGDNGTSAIAAPSHTYLKEGIYDISLNITDKYGCASNAAKPSYITVSDPKASFTYTGATEATCPPLIASPINTSKNYSSITWDFGDGAISSLATPTHVYTQGGEFDMKLTVKGFGECYAEAHQTIKLKGPSGSLKFNPLQICKPGVVSFTATSKNAVKTIWDFSDGNVETSSASTSSHNYTTYGTYVPKLVLTDQDGCSVGIESKDTLHVSGVKPAYIFSSQTSCDSSMAAFIDMSTPYYDAVKTYEWSFGDGTSSSQKSPGHFYNKTGIYQTKLLVKTNFGCTDSLAQTIDVTVHKSPVVSLFAPDSLCTAATLDLKAIDAVNETPATWQWTLGGKPFSTTQNTTYTFNEPGSYPLGVNAKTEFGCTDTATQAFVVVAPPALNAGLDTFVCQGGAVVLTASGANTYSWAANPTLSCSNCATVLANPTVAATYIVTGKNTFGCVATDQILVKVYDHENISTQNDTLCLGENKTLQVSGATLYEWSPATYLDNANSAVPVFHAAAETEITYQVKGMDEKKCFSDTKSLTVKVYPVPHIDIQDDDITLNVGSSVQLNMTASADVTQYRWSPQTFLSDATIASPIATPRNSVTYTCVATNEGSCFARDQISINVMCNQANMFVPNTFSPNGDGTNEHFFPRGKGVFNIKSMKIFNRWGQLVYEKNNFLPNVESAGWDGKFKGADQSSDVYVYILEITCDNNTVVPFKGNVTLLR